MIDMAKKLVLLLTAISVVAGCATTATNSESGKPVGIMTAVQAESELMFNNAIKRAGGINRFDHARLPATPETQRIVRSQSDMLYSHGVFDASKGLKVVMPKQMTGYQSVHLFDAGHGQIAVVYPGQTLRVKPEQLSTTDKHIYAMMRTSTDRGIEVANKAQDLVEVVAESNEPYVGPGYDEAQLAQAKRILAGAVPAGLVKAVTAYGHELNPDTAVLKAGTDIEKYHFIMSSLLGWGLMPNEHAYYPQLTIKDNRGGCTKVHFPKPPVKYDEGGYWSFTAYAMDGYLRSEKSVISAYKAKPNADGTYTVNIGSSEACQSAVNRVDMPAGGASITLRLYRPMSLEQAKAFEAELRRLNSGQ